MSSGIKGRKKIRVAFLNLGSEKWTGGLHYIRNLLYSISVLEDKRIEPYIFVGTGVAERLVEPVKPYATVIRTSVVDRKSFAWFAWKIIFLLTGSNFVLNRLLRRHNIQVVSHSNIWGSRLPFRLVNWIPDFQHLHLPEMFPEKEAGRRNATLMNMIRDSDCLVLSSRSAKDDLEKFMPGYGDKVKILNFVSQPKTFGRESDELLRPEIENKYSFRGKFFYMPNQFWGHKNHQVVFEAVKILKDAGLDILVLCSGHMNDFRNMEHVTGLRKYLVEHDLSENVSLLGLIDYDDVFALMRYSLAVINPSLFEGWSSTVEEAKSMGKGMILSDISVHREQNPPESRYFNPSDPDDLAAVMRHYWLSKNGDPDPVREKHARMELTQRTRSFGLAYQNIVSELDAV